MLKNKIKFSEEMSCIFVRSETFQTTHVDFIKAHFHVQKVCHNERTKTVQITFRENALPRLRTIGVVRLKTISNNSALYR